MWLFFGLPILMLGIASIVYASQTIDEVRANWSQYRCNPIYMPFAGMINPEVSTDANFMNCINQFGSEIWKAPIDAIMGAFGVIGQTLTEMTGPLDLFRKLFQRIRMFMLSFTASTMSKAATSTSVFIHFLIKIRDIFKRFVGQGYIASYLTYIIFAFVESFVTLFITILKTFVIVMLAISIVLALFQPELFAIVIALASILAAAGVSVPHHKK